MRVVLESVEKNLAKLVPDDKSGDIVVNRTLLPEQCEIGDVLEMEESVNKDEKHSFTVLPKETEKRIQDNKKKREQLMKRNH